MLSTALFHVAPAYLSFVYVGYLASEITELSIFSNAKNYIAATAKANHGISTGELIFLGDEKLKEQAYAQKRKVKNICLAVVPHLVKQKSTTAALTETTKHARFCLLLPNKFSSVDTAAKEADAIAQLQFATQNLFSNYSYFLEFTSGFAKKYSHTKSPDFLNMEELQLVFKEQAKTLVNVITFYNLTNNQKWKKYLEDLNHIITTKSLKQEKQQPSFSYLEKLGYELLYDINKCLDFIKSLHPDQVIKNSLSLLAELEDRLKRYEELCESMSGEFTVRQSNQLTKIHAKVFASLQHLSLKLEDSIALPNIEMATLKPTEFKIFFETLKNKSTIAIAPGHSRPLAPHEQLVMPNRCAFGLTKRRQQEKQIDAVLKSLKPETKEIVFSPYADFNESHIREAMDAKKLRDMIEGLKTELQWFILFKKHLLEHFPGKKIGNLSAVVNQYQNQLEMFSKALWRIRTQPPEPKGLSSFRRAVTILGTKLTNFFRLSSAKNELKKAQHLFEILCMKKTKQCTTGGMRRVLNDKSYSSSLSSIETIASISDSEEDNSKENSHTSSNLSLSGSCSALLQTRSERSFSR